MANGLDQDPHLTLGKITVTEDMGHKIEGHLAANEVEVDTTDGHLRTTTGRLHHHRAIADRTGATAPMRDRATSHHHLARVVIRYQTHHLAMVAQKEATGDVAALQLAMSTSQATMAQGGQGSQMTDNEEGHAILEILEMALQQTNGEIEVEAEVVDTVTGTGSEVIPGISEGSAEMPRHDLGVQNDGTGTVTIGTTTSTVGVSCWNRWVSKSPWITEDNSEDVLIKVYHRSHDHCTQYSRRQSQRTRMRDMDAAQGVCSISTASCYEGDTLLSLLIPAFS